MEERIKELEEENARLIGILKKVFPEKSGDIFICGIGGEKDSLGLPENIYVCPSYGLDGFAIYSKTSDYTAPGY